MVVRKQNPSKINRTQAKESIEQAVQCLKDIPERECTENANRKIDEALSYCYLAKDKLRIEG